jgi:hypothetical protein
LIFVWKTYGNVWQFCCSCFIALQLGIRFSIK